MFNDQNQSEPADMLSPGGGAQPQVNPGQTNPAQSNPAQANPVQANLGQTNPAPAQVAPSVGVPPQANNSQQAPQANNPQQHNLQRLESELTGGYEKKSYTTIIMAGVIIVLVLVGGYLAYLQFRGSTESEPEVALDNNGINSETGRPENIVQPTDTELPVPVVPLDTDLDGLSDEEEERYGTDKNHPDTDKDSLFDKAEIMTYKTDPLVADSDGDGYSDGKEIANNYDPLDATPGAVYKEIGEELNKTNNDIK